MSTVQKWGNSLGVRIPKAIAEQVNLESGTQVDFDTSGGVLTIRPKRRRRQRLAALLARVKGPSPYRSLDADGRLGRELV
jgi:antitoxin MazE